MHYRLHGCSAVAASAWTKKDVEKRFHADVLIHVLSAICQLYHSPSFRRMINFLYSRKSWHRRPDEGCVRTRDIWAENRDILLKSGRVATVQLSQLKLMSNYSQYSRQMTVTWLCHVHELCTASWSTHCWFIDIVSVGKSENVDRPWWSLNLVVRHV